jgi:hypothetical protein
LSHCSKRGASASKKSALEIPQDIKPKVFACALIFELYSLDFNTLGGFVSKG